MANSPDPIGAAPPPPWETPNFENPRDVYHTAHIVYTSLIQAIVVFFFAVRVYTKLSVDGRFQLEDWSCLIGWIFTVVLNSVIIIRIHYGLGFHIWEITKSNYMMIQKWTYISNLLYSPAAFFTKMALILLTVRVFSISTGVSRALYSSMVFFLLCYITMEFFKAFVCNPVQAYWDPTIPNLRCINQTILFMCDTSVSILSDLVILGAPTVLAWRLRVSTAKRLKIILLLGTGGLGVAVTVFRLFLVVRYNATTDPTTDFVPLDWTVEGELAIGLICACLPPINHLIEKRATRRRSSNNSRDMPPWLKEIPGYICFESLWSVVVTSGMATDKSPKFRSADSSAVLQPTHRLDRDRPQQSGCDVELGALSDFHPEPHPGELVLTTVESYRHNWLTPPPVVQCNSSVRLDSPP
ncbi:hypothetical protein LZ32DRAFT_546446 [Colletotrichum eremochloae]|nr:hypothetical protein LZ32DRAFT_546446 [Colletotrichum eremochloae]